MKLDVMVNRETINELIIKTPPNTACTRLVGVGAFSDRLCGLKLVPAKRRCLVPPTSG